MSEGVATACHQFVSKFWKAAVPQQDHFVGWTTLAGSEFLSTPAGVSLVACIVFCMTECGLCYGSELFCSLHFDIALSRSLCSAPLDICMALGFAPSRILCCLYSYPDCCRQATHRDNALQCLVSLSFCCIGRSECEATAAGTVD